MHSPEGYSSRKKPLQPHEVGAVISLHQERMTDLLGILDKVEGLLKNVRETIYEEQKFAEIQKTAEKIWNDLLNFNLKAAEALGGEQSEYIREEREIIEQKLQEIQKTLEENAVRVAKYGKDHDVWVGIKAEVVQTSREAEEAVVSLRGIMQGLAKTLPRN